VTYWVEYLFDVNDPKSECWSFLSLLPDLDGATALAREGLPDVREHFGAKGFRIFDDADAIVAEEFVSLAAGKPIGQIARNIM
jgi:hypothetical protein